jgi:hypothetical protein
MKRRYNKLVNVLLGALISVLGFGSCSHKEEVLCVYGPPPEEITEDNDTAEAETVEEPEVPVNEQ